MKDSGRKRLHYLLAALGLALLALAGAHGCAHSRTQELRPFATDGCSRFPDGTREDPLRWKQCCVEHDRAYWLGGTREDRLRADDALMACVGEIENLSLARTMWLGVRAGGGPYWPTKYRWAHGWPFTRGYRALTEEETERARSLLASQSDPKQMAGSQQRVALERE